MLLYTFSLFEVLDSEIGQLFLQAPEEDYFSVHIRIVGDWTSKSWCS